MAWTALCFRLSVLVAMMMATVCQAEDCFRLTAATNFDGGVFLISGDRFVLLHDFREVADGNLSAEFYKQEGNVEAAFLYPYDDTLYFFGGDKFHYYSNFWKEMAGPYDIDEDFDVFTDGMDAAGAVNGRSFYFKGCEFVEEEYFPSDPEDLRAYNLPCDVDAAWSQDGLLYITKGNRYWAMAEDKSVEASGVLSDLLSLSTVELCKDEDPLVARRRAEQAYEQEHQCVVVDAALTYKGVAYLFNDDEYLTLDGDLQESEKTDISDPWDGWRGIPAEEDAAVVWPENRVAYFFKGSSYYKYGRFLSVGPLSNDRWTSAISDGVDAAGSFGGKTLLFKGCEILQYGADEVETTYDSCDVNLPCGVDSAFSFDGNLYVVKGDQIWTWGAGGDRAVGPDDFASVVSLTSWKLCPATDQEGCDDGNDSD